MNLQALAALGRRARSASADEQTNDGIVDSGIVERWNLPDSVGGGGSGLSLLEVIDGTKIRDENRAVVTR